jgi:hypothetical protein
VILYDSVQVTGIATLEAYRVCRRFVPEWGTR